MDIYIATVALERTRWGKKQCSFAVSEWLDRFKADGFDGVELWENHYLRADQQEQERLEESAPPLAVFNSYVNFDDDAAEARASAAEAARRLQARAVKYNIYGALENAEQYRVNLKAWAAELPSGCDLLCECHGGSMLEKLDDAKAFFDEMDPDQYGIIAHAGASAAERIELIDVFGERVRHVHLQLRDPATDPGTPEGMALIESTCACLKKHGFEGTMALEFTRGIGKEEDLETLYANACADLRAYKECWERDV